MKTAALWMFVPLLTAQTGAVIEGTAFNRITGVGVPGVTVKLAAVSDPSKILHTVKGDSAGAFRVEGVPGGDYVASFDAPDGFFAPAFWEPPCKPFHAAEGGRAVKLQVPMQPLATLRVRVIDREGRPVPNVYVECFLATGGGGASGSTDSEGRFSQGRIAPGAYKLRARPILPGSPLAQRSKELSVLSLKPPEGERWVWAPTYFPDSAEIAGAETIVASEGAELPEYQIRLRSAPVYRLRGTVSDEEGKPASVAAVWILSEIGWGPAETRVASGPDGGFEFPSVRAGQWQIAVEAKRGKAILKGFMQVYMPQHDLEDVAVRVTPPFTLDSVAEGLPDNATGPSVSLIPLADPYDERANSRRRPNGTRQFEDVYAEQYRVGQWGVLPGYYLKSILLGEQDVTGRVVDLTPQSPLLKLIYRPNAARALGTVENGAGVKVVLVDAAQDEFVPGQDIRVAVCDERGRFTIEGLRPATYYAFAFAIGGVNTGAVREAVFLLGLSRQAQTIRLGESETANIELHITPFPLALQRP